MKLLNKTEVNTLPGKIQLLRRSKQDELLSEAQNLQQMNQSQDDLLQIEISSLKRKAFEDGTKLAEIELKQEMTDLQQKFDAELKAMQDKYETQINDLRNISSALKNTIDNANATAFECAIEISFEAIIRILGQNVIEKTMMADLCANIYAENKKSMVGIALNQIDFELLNVRNFPVPLEISTDIARGQCRVIYKNGYSETGIDVRLNKIKNEFLNALKDSTFE